MANLRHIGNHHKQERVNPLHHHTYHETVLYLSGEGTVEIEGKTFPFHRGTVMSIAPGIPHLERAAAPYRSLSFGYDRGRGRIAVRHGQDGPGEPLRSLALLMLREYYRKGPHWERLCDEGLALFLTWIETRNEGDGENPWVDRVEHLLLTHLTEPGFRLLPALEKLGPSPSHLIRLFTKARGMSPLQFLLHNRVQEAVHLLEMGHTSVTDVAHRVGFEDPYYFSRTFRKWTGKAPTHYVKKKGKAPSRFEPERTMAT